MNESILTRLIDQRFAFMVSGFRSDPSSILVFRFDLISHFFACECLCLNLCCLLFELSWCLNSLSIQYLIWQVGFFWFFSIIFRMFSLLYRQKHFYFECKYMLKKGRFLVFGKGSAIDIDLSAFPIFDFFTSIGVEFPNSWGCVLGHASVTIGSLNWKE